MVVLHLSLGVLYLRDFGRSYTKVLLVFVNVVQVDWVNELFLPSTGNTPSVQVRYKMFKKG